MAEKVGQFASLSRIIPCDVTNELSSRAENRLSDKEFSEYKRMLEGDDVDENYKSLLFGLLIKEEELEPHKKRKDKDVVMHDDSTSEEENDPQYENFLKHLKKQGKSYVLEYEKNSVPVAIKYEVDMDSDEECGPEPKSKLTGVKEEKIELPNRIPGVKNQHMHDQQSNPVSKTKGLKRRKLTNEADKVESMKSSPNDTVPDPEYLNLHQNDKFKDGDMHKGGAVVNGKICEVNDQKEERPSKLSGAMRQKIGHSNQMPGVDNQHKHDLQSTSVNKTEGLTRRKSGNEAEKMENIKDLANDKVPDHDKEQNKQGRRKRGRPRKHGLPNQTPGTGNLYKHDPPCPSVRKSKRLAERKTRNEADKVDNEKKEKPRRSSSPMIEIIEHFKRIPSVENHPRRSSSPIIEKIGHSKRMPAVDNQHKHELQSASVKKTKSWTQRKLRNEAEKVEDRKGLPNDTMLEPEYQNEGDHCINMPKGHTVANDQKKQDGRKLQRGRKPKVKHSNQMPGVKDQHKHDPQLTSIKSTRSLTLRRSRNEADDVEIEKCSPSEFWKAKAAKSFTAPDNISENNLGKEGDDSSVEILDTDKCLKEGISNPFVPSKQHYNWVEKVDSQHLNRLSLRNEFRKKVLNVLRKPYDKEEYCRHQEAVRAGSYFDYHPDLQKKLNKYRYKPGKRLTILRGFFFWLQHLTQEGSFQPWTDRECLAVEPGPPENLSPAYSGISGS